MTLLADRDAARRWFEFLAPGYDAVVPSLFWSESLQMEGLDRLDVDDDDSVLDVGCGTGETSALLRERVATVHGLDQSRSQLETAASKDALADVALVRADAHRLPYGDGSFDHVVSIGSILYWTEPSAALREAYRVTRPGGSILVMGFNRRSLSLWNAPRNVQDAINAALFVRYDPAEGTRLFRDAGWERPVHEVTGPAWSPDLVVGTVARKPD